MDNNSFSMYIKPETNQIKKGNNDITKEEPIYAIPISDHNDASVLSKIHEE